MSKLCPINNLASKDILNKIMPTGMVFDELIFFACQLSVVSILRLPFSVVV